MIQIRMKAKRMKEPLLRFLLVRNFRTVFSLDNNKIRIQIAVNEQQKKKEKKY